MERSPEIEGLMRRMLRVISASDVDGFYAFLSAEPGRRLIGSDPREWYAGDEDAVFITQLPEYAAAGGMTLDFVEGEAFEEGSVGWGALKLMIGLGQGELFPMRVTMVFHLEGGHWQMVQMHCSVPATNEQVLGVELTTSLDAVAEAVSSDRPGLGVGAAPDGTVTIMFTDVEASTEMAERLGDRAWAELLRWHRSATEESAARNRGRIVKGLGDGFMLAFPSASDGLRCAAAMQETMRAGWRGEPLHLRVGLHSGDAVRAADDFYGHAVTVAARVAALAQGGEILATRLVADLAERGSFRFSSPRSVSLKGIDGAIEVVPLLPTEARVGQP
ncbi:MAG TPA: adenylate/guanylate cyclase domain-containing protein [Acidimicrobiales bacterium]|nr:adenylate/guanylate cyclase domain-containing protein [Acidimicrobiales bacterium]